MLTMKNIEEALKIYYLPGLRYQLNDKASALLAQIEKSSENVVGREIRMALRYGRVGGIGNRPDDGDLPKPSARKTLQAIWETKNIFARFSLTDKTIEASKTSVGAFANMLEQEISDCETDARLDLSRQVMGAGKGVLATLTAAYTTSSSTEVTVDTTMYLAEGMIVDFRNATTGATANDAHAGVEIKGILSPTKFTIDDPGVTITSGSVVTVAGNVYSKSGAIDSYELTGVRQIVATGGSLYGINRVTNPWLDAVVDNVNGSISEVGIQANIDAVEVGSGSETNFLLCSKGVARAYQNLQTAMKQHINTLDLKGGWTALEG